MDLNRQLEDKKFYGTAVIIAAVFFILLLYFVDPNHYTYYPLCTFKVITGYDCPGCGGIRGTHQLLHMHFIKAFRYNPLVYFSTPIIFYSVIYYSALLIFRKQLPKIPVNGVTITVVSVAVLIFWIIRILF